MQHSSRDLACVSAKVDLANTGDAGRGLVAKDRIKQDEALLQVPEGMCAYRRQFCPFHCPLLTCHVKILQADDVSMHATYDSIE